MMTFPATSGADYVCRALNPTHLDPILAADPFRSRFLGISSGDEDSLRGGGDSYQTSRSPVVTDLPKGIRRVPYVVAATALDAVPCLALTGVILNLLDQFPVTAGILNFLDMPTFLNLPTLGLGTAAHMFLWSIAKPGIWSRRARVEHHDIFVCLYASELHGLFEELNDSYDKLDDSGRKEYENRLQELWEISDIIERIVSRYRREYLFFRGSIFDLLLDLFHWNMGEPKASFQIYANTLQSMRIWLKQFPPDSKGAKVVDLFLKRKGPQ